MPSITIVDKGCPICGGTVKGNASLKYFCEHCNLLFARQELAVPIPTQVSPAQPGGVTKSPLKELKYALQSMPRVDKLAEVKTEYSQALEEEETLADETVEAGYELDEPSAFVVSAKSDKVHAGNCHFLKKIHKSNRQYPTLEKALEDGYELCVCLRRRKMQGLLQMPK